MGLCRYALLAAVLGLAVQSAGAQTTRQRLVVFGDGLADNGDGGAQLYARSLTGNDTLVCFESIHAFSCQPLQGPLIVEAADIEGSSLPQPAVEAFFSQQGCFRFGTLHLHWVLVLAQA